MPNGGFPIEMEIEPASGAPHLVRCKGGRLQVLSASQEGPRLLFELTPSESALIADFLGHYSHSDPKRPRFNALGVKVSYT